MATTLPSPSTTIRSAMRTLEKRCETSTAVLPWESSLKRWNTSNSARASSAAVLRGERDALAVVARLDPPDRDVLSRRQMEALEVLEDHADVGAQLEQVVLAQVVAVERDAALVGVIEAR